MTLRRFNEILFQVILLIATSITVFTTVGIVAVLLYQSALFFKEVSLKEFLTDTQWTPLFTEKHFGILPLLAGTFLTSTIAMAVALPMGLIIAVFLSEYASSKVRGIVKPILEILTAVPTVVYGYFALLFVTPLLKKVIPSIAGFNALSPGIVMGIMILPIVASLSEDALRAVPNSLREAAYALGADRFTTALKVVIPTAFSGIMAAFILGISRAIGETMIVTIAAGQRPVLTLNPLVPIETITAYIVQVSLGDVPTGTLEYHTIFAAGLALFVITFVFNVVSYLLKKRTWERSR
ncbi:MAG: phosphate ABC transporter permease subunit PstC [Thermotogae bacterium]|nr:phosphate ABC transporter permease subunit PstC [Thermotogota bacterium]